MKEKEYITNIPVFNLPTVSRTALHWKEMIHLVERGQIAEYIARMKTDHPREFVMQQTNVLSFVTMYRPMEQNPHLPWTAYKVCLLDYSSETIILLL